MTGKQISGDGETSRKPSTPSKQKTSGTDISPIPEDYPSTGSSLPHHVSNPVQRSASHAKNQTSKAEPMNTGRRPDARRINSLRKAMPSGGSTNPSRPGLQRQNTSFQTRYIEMLLNLDTIPRLHNILASFFTWILLAGFVSFPGTFTSIQDDLSSDSTGNNNQAATEAASVILSHVKSIPLLVVASVCCGIGIMGMIWLSIRWRKNYLWLLNRLYLPGATNGLAGLISTIVSVYESQGGQWSVSARVTGGVEGGCVVVCGVLFLFYQQILLRSVKRKHTREMEQMEHHDHSNILARAEKKLKEPALEPGSVV